MRCFAPFTMQNGLYMLSTAGTKERIDNMARDKSIRYQLKSELKKMESYGRSKHADMQQTRIDRSIARANGLSKEEIQKIDHTKMHIYSKCTMQNYQREIDRFADYLKTNGLNKISMQEAEHHVQEYLDYLQHDKHLSAPSVHSSCAALCKVFHDKTMWDYTKPERTISAITRGNQTFKDKDVNMVKELEKNRIWSINREYLGMRKNELCNLRADMIKEKEDRCEIHYIGKGGKHNIQIFYGREKDYVLSLKEGKQPHEHIFSKTEINECKNLHKARELRAKDMYERICKDIETRGKEAEREYIMQIERCFHEAHKTLHENLNNDYHVRGANRERLIAENRPTSYNRIALLMVSTHVLQHFRSDTTCNHYVAK